MLRPKLFDTLKTYHRQQFTKDLMSGLIVGLVALPLAVAFAIASGVSPEKGLYTAVIAGFIISAMGGSRVQIGGPTGAFIVIVYGIVQVHGIDGLIIATFIAGIILIVMGFARLGSVIKFIPYPLIVGFTSGIALIILSSQVKDFFGLQMGAIPADFTDKWESYIAHFQSVNIYAVLIGSATIAIISLWPKITGKVPGSLIAILFTTAIMHLLHLPVETIGSKFGSISSSLPKAVFPHLDVRTIKNLIQPAFTIALLGGIESLLSAVVSDGMIGGNHRSNMELIAQGTANIFSAVFGGIPATGAIARTATNVKNGGRTPVAGMIHSITLLLILLFFGKWAALIPLATLAGILVVVAYNMSEWRHFLSVLKGPKSDRAILLATFLLTVLIDLTVAIEMGLVLAAFLFLRNMIRFTEVSSLKKEMEDNEGADQMEDPALPKHVEVFEINGPLFFGAAYKFKDAMRLIERPPKVLIIRMRKVPIIDATGLKTIKDVYTESKQGGTKLILSEVHSEQVMEELKEARLVFAIGKANITDTFEDAIQRSKVILLEAG
ncbi:SulP family inorganic anion transporter [Flavitalea sp. BT771]|uniref:SulP family inorganic anion transporter n=1 Tax=Flavitalea sp. BT771 TaxID=3063329 RepID=UPI0026E44ABD|nr:SulP family inorganic anion transporter [Flavitalea sp. BT771]MDO6432221.1 SulP family inorganic anion transporter [Flavitalea sp. BT771]MDV6221131.1 SulP family inorganic anion transporter [Flavitalea sp. BT771]